MTNRVSFRTFGAVSHAAAVAIALALAAPTPALAASTAKAAKVVAPTIEASIRGTALEPGVRDFYAARGYRPLWLERDGSLSAAAQAFLGLAENAALDEVDDSAFGLARLQAAVAEAQRDKSPTALARADTALSQSFAAYVRATRSAPSATMLFEHDQLKAHAPGVRDVLEVAARSPSLADYIGEMRWMHPLYAPLRTALSRQAGSDEESRAVIEGNLARIRAIPAEPAKRYVLVDAASARLWMYEDGRPVDSMKVVVGKPDLQTPMMAGYIRYAILNPYWNVPPDLIRKNIAPNVIKGGAAYLRNGGYQVLSDWTDTAEVVDPATVNWKAVAAGTREVRVRQLPGGSNFMGKVKYEFPNKLGIYLHDTPDKDLMLKDARQLSSGCIRLEDADRLGRWLMRQPLPAQVEGAERRVDLPEVVPVYVTYLTARPENGQIAMGPDPYRRDQAIADRFARGPANTMAARR